MIKAIVFDLDGTLIDSVRLHAVSWIKAFQAHGYHNVSLEDIEMLIGLPGNRIVERVLGADALNRYQSIKRIKDREFLSLISNVRLYPYATKVIKEIKNMGLKLALATSTPSYILNRLLPLFNLDKEFSVIIPGEIVSEGKPNPEIFLKAFQSLDTDPEEGVIVGDSEYDIIPAKLIGSISILILTNKLIDPRKFSVKPDYIVHNLYDVLNIIRKIF